jgi:transcriptional regulator with XRE-family HTH domain
MIKANPKRKPVRHFIRSWRKHRGYTLEQLAEMIGVTHGALSQLERGAINYTQPMLEALAEALACEPADLIMRDPASEIWSIYDTLEKLPKEDREQVERIVQTFRRVS